MSDAQLIQHFKRMFKCDSARITRPLGTMFLVIGWKRSTRQDQKQTGAFWMDEKGNVKHWTYINESVVASGDTEAELMASARHYKRLTKMTWEQFFANPATQPNER